MNDIVKISLATLFLCSIGCAVPKQAPRCPAPAASIIDQVKDLCLLRNSSDDLDHPKVQDCIALLGQQPNDCEHRLLVKRQRCALLNKSNLLTMSVDECITSLSTEGNFVKKFGN